MNLNDPRYQEVLATLRASGFCDAAIFAAFGGIDGGASTSEATDILIEAQRQLDTARLPSILDVLTHELRRERELIVLDDERRRRRP